MDIGTFWTIVVFAFVLGAGALGGFVFFYWFVVLPQRLVHERRLTRR